MSRPKSDTPEGERATRKWKETMLKKYGSEEAVREAMSKIGTKGGKVSCTKGFGTSHERASYYGRIGGKKSSRAGIKNGQGKNKKRIK